MTSFTVETYGSSYHQAQAAMMRHLLQEAKFTPTDLENADFVILHACSYQSLSPEKLLERLKALETEHPYKMIIISGCAAQSEPEKFRRYPLVGNSQWHHIVEAVEERLANTFLKLRGMEEIPPLFSQHITGIEASIPLQHGILPCLEYHAAPSITNLKSYPPEEIQRAVQQCIAAGAKMITLTGLDIYSYALDNHTLPSLLRLLSSTPGDFQLLLESGNSEYLLRKTADFIAAFSHPKFFHWLRLPLFSGSEKILAKLERPNIKTPLLDFIQKLRAAIPDITISTDIVIGHPEETEQDHWDSVQLLRRINPDSITLYQFSSPGGKALEEEIVNQRLKTIYDLSQNMAKIQNERWLGWVGKVLVEKSGLQSIARNSGYKKVLLEGDYSAGSMLKAKITRVTSTELKGEIIHG